MAVPPPPSRLPRDLFVDAPTVSVEIPRARQGDRWVDPPPAPPAPAPRRSTALAVAALVLGIVCLVLVVAGLVVVLGV